MRRTISHPMASQKFSFPKWTSQDSPTPTLIIIICGLSEGSDRLSIKQGGPLGCPYSGRFGI